MCVPFQHRLLLLQSCKGKGGGKKPDLIPYHGFSKKDAKKMASPWRLRTNLGNRSSGYVLFQHLALGSSSPFSAPSVVRVLIVHKWGWKCPIRCHLTIIFCLITYGFSHPNSVGKH